MEFLIDTGMELARNLIFKTMKTICEYGQQKGAGAATDRHAEAVRDFLQPQLDRLEAEIKDLAEGTYKTSLSHLHHALVILNSTFTQLDSSSGSSVVDRIRNETRDGTDLPQEAKKLIMMSYDKAYNSYNYTTNLPLEKRATAMQVAVLCIGLQHISDPHIILSRWERCIHDVFKDAAMVKCIERNLGTSKMPKFMHGQKKGDMDNLVIMTRDILTQITRFAAREDVQRTVVVNMVEHIVHPVELNEETRLQWAEHIKWKECTRSIKFHDEIKLRDPGIAYDGCCLPDGNFVIVKGNDEVAKHNMDLEKTVSTFGTYYGVTYDPAHNRLLAWSKRKNALVALNPDTLLDTGLEISCPLVGHPSTVDVARWHTFAAANGIIVIGAQLVRTNGVADNDPFLYMRRPEDSYWHQLDTSQMQRSKITSVAVRQDNESSLRLAIGTEGRSYQMKVSLPEMKVEECKVLFPEQLVDAMSSTINEQGVLVAVVRRQFIYMLNEDWDEIMTSTFGTPLSGLWVAAGHRRIYTPTLTGQIKQYDYFVL